LRVVVRAQGRDDEDNFLFQFSNGPERHCKRSEAIHSFFVAAWIASLRSQ
jgi:hypothetical protein